MFSLVDNREDNPEGKSYRCSKKIKSLSNCYSIIKDLIILCPLLTSIKHFRKKIDWNSTGTRVHELGTHAIIANMFRGWSLLKGCLSPIYSKISVVHNLGSLGAL